MILLFKSDSCLACLELYYNIVYGDYKSWASHITFVEIRFSEEEQCDKAYIDGVPTDGPSPVDAVPTMYFCETEEVLHGYDNIKERLLNGHK